MAHVRQSERLMHYRVTHTTRYRYAQPVSQCQNEARMRPRATPRQKCTSHRLYVSPEPASRHEREDVFGNHVAYFAVQKAHTVLEVTALSEVQLTPGAPLDAAATPPWESVAQSLRGTDSSLLEAREFVLASPFAAPGDGYAEYARACFTPGRPLLEAATALMEQIHDEFEYDPLFTTVATPLDQVFAHRRGVCQDFAHLLIACLRALGLPARYVSGYLETEAGPGQEKLRGADASHAWVAVFCPGAGWIDLDPTNRQLPDTRHLTLAWGRDYGDVAPLNGVIRGGGPATLEVEVDVIRA